MSPELLRTSTPAPARFKPSLLRSLVHRWIEWLERAFGLVVLVSASPLLLIIGVLIRLDSRGPVIFQQLRVSKTPRLGSGHSEVAENLFVLYKFRSFYQNADEILPQRANFQFDKDALDSVFLQIEDDPRATKVGRILRRWSLDELPNLLNVVKGDMRLVGPRPEVPQMLEYYTQEQLAKFTVKPGLTGLPQVSGRGNLNFRQTVELDVQYVRERSTVLDTVILLRTLKLMVTREGAF